MEQKKMEQKIPKQPKEQIEAEAKPKQPKGAGLFRCNKIKYMQDNHGYVMLPEKDGKPVKLDPQILHKDLIEKKLGKTSTIDEQDITLLNSQSLNTGIFYQKI